MLWWRGECWLLRKKVILVEAHPLKRGNIAVLQMFSSVFHFLWNLISTLFCQLFLFSCSLSLIAARNILSEQHSLGDDHWDLSGFFDNFQIKLLYQPFLFTLHQYMSFMSKKSKYCFSLELVRSGITFFFKFCDVALTLKSSVGKSDSTMYVFTMYEIT